MKKINVKTLISPNTSDNNFTLITIVVALYSLHLLRNISILFPMLCMSISLILTFYIKKSNNKIDENGLFFFSLFLLFSLYSFLISFFSYPNESYLLPAGRFFYMIPFMFFLFFVAYSKNNIIYILKLIAIFVVIGGLSVFYQIIFGSISWFVESSFRNGLIRYTSLMGNLTAYGFIGGLTLPIIWFLFQNKLIRICLCFIVISGMLMTLQKAAVANIFLFFLIIYFNTNSPDKHRYSFYFLIVAVLSLGLFYALNIKYVVGTLDNIFHFQSLKVHDDVPLFQSILDRLWKLPSKLYDYHGLSGMLFGVGMVGGSGCLVAGLENYPMAHNLIFELIFIGGIGYFLSFLGIYLLTIKRSFYLISFENDQLEQTGKLAKVSWITFLIFGCNSVFISGAIYQPYSAMIIFSIAFHYLFYPMSYNQDQKLTWLLNV